MNFATIWNTVLFYPFLNVLVALYHILWDNFGLAVIVIAIIVRAVLIPAVKKQTEMTRKMADLKPKLDALQKKYANNQKKLAEEQMRLYKEVGYNPVGCLTSFIPQILILYVMIQVINVITQNNFTGIYDVIKNWVFASGKEFNTIFFSIGNFSFDLAKQYLVINSTNGAREFLLGSPAYLLLALLVGFVQWLSTKFMQIMQGQVPQKGKGKEKEKTPEQVQMEMMNSMNLLFPIMTIIISLTNPSVLALYWLIQSLMMIVQYYFIDKVQFVSAWKQIFSFSKFKLNKKK